jgi:hypothetical protein
MSLRLDEAAGDSLPQKAMRPWTMPLRNPAGNLASLAAPREPLCIHKLTLIRPGRGYRRMLSVCPCPLCCYKIEPHMSLHGISRYAGTLPIVLSLEASYVQCAIEAEYRISPT